MIENNNYKFAELRVSYGGVIKPLENTVSSILGWFKEAVPAPEDKNRRVQTGVHFEEVAEMLEALRLPTDEISKLATALKKGEMDLPEPDRIELLDSLCDQIVTAVGVAHMFGMDIVSALKEVDASNWSKFGENGKPIFDENGKIKKGANYFKPELTNYV
jgi:predicted HAD superfamily Cof-like phosphohydrolase